MNTQEKTFDKSQYNPFVFAAYKMIKKLIKYSFYLLTIYALYSGVEWLFEG